MMQTAPLSNLQQELLKLYAQNITEQQLNDIKQILAQYFAQQAIQSADQVWEQRKLSQDDIDVWLNESA